MIPFTAAPIPREVPDARHEQDSRQHGERALAALVYGMVGGGCVACYAVLRKKDPATEHLMRFRSGANLESDVNLIVNYAR